ncbi:MAG: hypothetical protein GXP47_01720 [Acidobacteria bacterium]|nr:hypothetical protein [Acidobacteriota bacterium]
MKMQQRHVLIGVGLVLMLALDMPLAAQTPASAAAHPAKTAPPAYVPVTKTLKIRHGDVGKIAKVLSLIGGTATADPDLGVIVWTGSPQLAPAVEAAARSLDVAPEPATNIQLTIHFLAQADDTVGKPLPEDLQSVGQQLHKVLGVQGLRLLETAIIRVRDGGSARVDGTLPSRFGKDVTGRYTISIRKVRVADDAGKAMVHLGRFRVWINGFLSPQNHDSFATETDLDIADGQHVVVSRASVNGFTSGVFVVVSAHVVS